jgi:hypothetical protein
LTSRQKIYLISIGIIPIIFTIYSFFNIDHKVGLRESILNSQYEIIAHPNDYQVVERYFFLEKIVAEKKSTIFFNSFSKIGLINPSNFEVRLLDDTKKMIKIEIKTTRNGQTIDTLNKIDF